MSSSSKLCYSILLLSSVQKFFFPLSIHRVVLKQPTLSLYSLPHATLNNRHKYTNTSELKRVGKISRDTHYSGSLLSTDIWYNKSTQSGMYHWEQRSIRIRLVSVHSQGIKSIQIKVMTESIKSCRCSFVCITDPLLFLAYFSNMTHAA